MKQHLIPEVVFHAHDVEWLRQVEGFIDGHLDDSSLNIVDIANAVYTSERQFFRRIKKLTGETPNAFIRRKRLARARRILVEEGPSTLKEVARSVGFSRTDYFSNLFQKEYGVHPTELRVN